MNNSNTNKENFNSNFTKTYSNNDIFEKVSINKTVFKNFPQFTKQTNININNFTNNLNEQNTINNITQTKTFPKDKSQQILIQQPQTDQNLNLNLNIYAVTWNIGGKVISSFLTFQ